MNQSQDAEHHQRDKGEQANPRLQEGIVLDFDRGDSNANQVNIQHHPLFELIEHQQDRAQIHAQNITEPQIGDGDDQHSRCADGAKEDHCCGNRVTLVSHLPDPRQQIGVNTHPQQMKAQQRFTPGERHQ